MRTFLRCVLLLVSAAGCGAGSKAPATQAPEPVTNITGRERVAWDQDLLPDSRIEDYQFAVYVNGTRVALPSARCDSEPTADGLLCSAPLPPLRPGANSLEFVAILNGEESERSETLELEIGAPQAQADAAALPRGAVRAETVARGLRSPTDLAMLPDGRLLIAEREGRVRVFDGARLLDHAALVLDDADQAPGGGVLAVAVHPDFAHNRFVYLGYAARLANGDVTHRVIRTREVNNTLAEIAIVLESTAGGAPVGMSVRFGPDRKLYVGLAGCDCNSPYAGTILRLNDDGSTPRDSAVFSPIYARGLSVPVGLAWLRGQLWIADWNPHTTSALRTAAGERYPLPAGVTPGPIATGVRRGGDPALLMGRPDGGGLEQFHLATDAAQRLEHVTPAPYEATAVLALLGAPDGTLYVCASDSADGGASLMMLSRVP